MKKKYIIAILASTVFTYTLLWSTKIIVNYLSLDFLIIGDSSSWLSYFGSIVGSLITVMILLDTIKRDDTFQIKAEARNNQPYLYIFPEYEHKTLDYIIYHEAKDTDGNNLDLYQIKLKIKNLTNNPAKEIKLIYKYAEIYDKETEKWEDLDSEDQKYVNLYQLNITLLSDSKFIPAKEEDYYHLNFFINNLQESINRSGELFRLHLKVQYKDILDIAEYEHKYTLQIQMGRDIYSKLNLVPEPTITEITKIKYLIK